MTKAKIKEFVKFLREQVKNNSIYVWGGQGEKTKDLTIGKVLAMENSSVNARRVLNHIANLIEKKYDISNSRCFDCSGLGVYWLLKNKLISSDTTADGLYRMCKTKGINEIETGDFVFSITNGRATHVGYVVDGENKKIVEAFGRDVGVVEVTLGQNSSKFTVAGVFK